MGLRVVRGHAVRWVAIAWLAGCGDAETKPAAARPDVVLVTWDTARADHVGPDALVPGLTPHWNRIASGGARFRSARTPSPMTLPAHASLLTGQLPSAHGARVNTLFFLPETAQTLAERLAADGWQTGAFVSAAVLDSSFGLAQGFDTYDDRVVPGEERLFAERRADSTIDAAREWVRGVSEERPIFLWVHLFDPHAPWDPPSRWASAHAGAPYRGEIAFADEQTGRLLDALDAADRLDRTLLVMTADHGEGLGEHGEQSHSYFLYDTTVRVPLLFWAGEHSGIAIPRGSRLEAPVLLSDVAPTILELLGLEPISSDGTSLVSSLRGAGADLPARELALESVDPYYAFGTAPLFGVVDAQGDVWIDLPRRERYDIETDPEQLHNLYAPSLAPEADALFARHRRAWPPPETSVILDRPQSEQLAALGYLSARVGISAASAAGSRPDPKDLLPVAALWMGQLELRRADRALAQADELSRRFGPIPALAFFRADCLHALSRPGDAVAVLREAHDAFPAETRLRDELQATLRQQSQDRALADRIRVVWNEHPEHPGAVHDLAVVLHRLGETAEAERLYRLWLERHPEDDASRLDLHRLLGARGAFADALALLREVPAGAERNAKIDCAEGRLLAWWIDRAAEAKSALRACRDKGVKLKPDELALIGDA